MSKPRSSQDDRVRRFAEGLRNIREFEVEEVESADVEAYRMRAEAHLRKVLAKAAADSFRDEWDARFREAVRRGE